VARLVPYDPTQLAFTREFLVINDRRLADAVPELNRWYGVDIRIADSTLADTHLQATFKAGSIDDLMGILETAFDVRIVRDGHVLTIYPKSNS
jgi:ferric-dicitrate binding protein FerR (iron transport regulator)